MSGSSRELFPRKTGYLVDPLAAAESAVEMTLRVLLDPTRAARLNQQKILAPDTPSFPVLLVQLLDKVGLATARQRQKPSDKSEILLQLAQRRALNTCCNWLVTDKSMKLCETWAAVGKLQASLRARWLKRPVCRWAHGRRTISGWSSALMPMLIQERIGRLRLLTRLLDHPFEDCVVSL